VKQHVARITMSAERLAMMSAEIRSQLLALLSPAIRLIVVATITASARTTTGSGATRCPRSCGL